MNYTALKLTLLIILYSGISFSQDVIMIEYDMQTKVSNVLNFGPMLPDENSGETPSHSGSNTIGTLDSLVAGENFSRLNLVEDEILYPASSSVKIVLVNQGQQECLCSGTMISKRHILSAAHCFLNIGDNKVQQDSLVVIPAFNNGQANQSIGQHLVSKAYSFQNWFLNGNDFIVLEIDQDVGSETGWHGIAFNNSDDALRNRIYHKFSYPRNTSFSLFEGEINGDTLYHSYGVFNLVDEFISTQFAEYNSFTGESGSSIFLHNNQNENYIYGVSTWSNNLPHSRIDQDEFFGISEIIEPYNSTSISVITHEEIRIFPNPTTEYIDITLSSLNGTANLSVSSLSGKIIKEIELKEKVDNLRINTTEWASGIYFITLKTKDKLTTKKLIKY